MLAKIGIKFERIGNLIKIMQLLETIRSYKSLRTRNLNTLESKQYYC